MKGREGCGETGKVKMEEGRLGGKTREIGLGRKRVEERIKKK